MWVSLTCSPEHTARQCRNFTFPAAAVKWQNYYRCGLVPLIIACITLNMHIERCPPACITLSMHIVVHIVAHIVVHSVMHIKVQEITWGGCPPPRPPRLTWGGVAPPDPPWLTQYWPGNLNFPNLSIGQATSIFQINICKALSY